MIDRRLIRGVRQFFVMLLLVIGIVGGIGSLLYLLYKVATFNKSVYAIIFYITLGGLILFYTYKGIRKKILSNVFLKLAQVLLKVVVILCIISAIMLYGALVVRHPIVGGIATPFLVAFLIIGGLRFGFFAFLKKFFQ